MNARGDTFHLAHTSNTDQTRLEAESLLAWIKLCMAPNTVLISMLHHLGHLGVPCCYYKATRYLRQVIQAEPCRKKAINLMNCHSCHVFRWFATMIPFFWKFSPSAVNSTICLWLKNLDPTFVMPHCASFFSSSVVLICWILAFRCVSENYAGLIDCWWCILQSAFNAPLIYQVLQIYWRVIMMLCGLFLSSEILSVSQGKLNSSWWLLSLLWNSKENEPSYKIFIKHMDACLGRRSTFED